MQQTKEEIRTFYFLHFNNYRCVSFHSHYVKSYIDFPKPLVAVVNGPAMGVSVTVLGLFDIVYATKSVSYLLVTVCY